MDSASDAPLGDEVVDRGLLETVGLFEFVGELLWIGNFEGQFRVRTRHLGPYLIGFF